MDISPLLTIYIEISVAIAVGSGIVVALKHQDRSEWRIEEKVQFRFTVIAGGTAAAYSALPILLTSYGLEGDALWRTTSIAFLAVTTILGPLRAYQVRSTPTFTPSLVMILASTALGIYSIFLGKEWMYLVLVSLLLFNVFAAFAVLVIASANLDGEDV